MTDYLYFGKIEFGGEIVSVPYKFVDLDTIEFLYLGVKYFTHYKSLIVGSAEGEEIFWKI